MVAFKKKYHASSHFLNSFRTVITEFSQNICTTHLREVSDTILYAAVYVLTFYPTLVTNLLCPKI